MFYKFIIIFIIALTFVSCTTKNDVNIDDNYDIKISLNNDLKIEVTWNSLILNNKIKNYEVYKSTNKDADYILTKTISLDDTLDNYVFIDDFIIDGRKTYYYKVRAITIISDEKFSDIVSYKASTDIDEDGFIENDCAANISDINPRKTEVCDGKDNNCSGAIDDGIEDIIVGTDLGECQKGISKCVNGETIVIQSEVKPSIEICDGKDNDCNDLIDDNLENVIVGTDIGECQKGISECLNGELVAIQEEIKPNAEICDGKDNDCNQKIDDLEDIITGTDVGECQIGIKRCVDSQLVTIQEEIAPINELCDNLDNDCNNKIDDQLFKDCSSICGNGETICIEGHWLGCDALVSSAGDWSSNYPLKVSRFAKTQNKNNTIFIFSGLLSSGELSNELWKYNTQSKVWENLKSIGESPSPRVFSSLTYRLNSNELYLYGGTDNQGNILNDFWKYDIENETWTPISARGEMPSELSSLSIFSDNFDNIILFGGKSNDAINENTYKYSISENRWYLINNLVYPTARYNHSMVYNHATNSIFIFGGNLAEDTFTNELWRFNLNTFDWSLEGSDSNIANITKASIYTQENSLFIFGGITEDNSTTLNIYKYNIDSQIWKTIALEQSNIISAMIIGDGSDIVSIWGGEKLNTEISNTDIKFDLDTETYFVENNISNIYKATTTFDSTQNKNYLFGGFNQQGFSNDLWEYNPNNNTWNKVYLTNQPEAREASSITFDEEEHKLYLYGGNDDAINYGDLWVLDLDTKMAWEKLNITDGPSYRRDAYLFYRRGEIYLFGGIEEGSNMDLYKLNKLDNKWEKVEYVNDSPETRENYSVIYSPGNNYLFVFGGSNNNVKYNDLWSLDIDNKKWVNYSIGIVKPSQRDNSKFLYDYNKETVYLLGGVDENNNYLSDVWSLEIGSFNWSLIKEDTNFSDFNQRLGLSTFFVNNNDNQYIYVLGGKSNINYFYLQNKLKLLCE